ncbi:MAG TPA: hypothetical protein VGR37_18910 [Longimicrobiaceae bacterium]|nr:hypothetical protein [Longimicrobiaceae bacterium]
MIATLHGALLRAAGRALPLLLLAAAAALAPSPAVAQVPERIAVSDTLVEVRLSDGSTLFGRVVEVQDGRIVLETQAGARVELSRAQIRSLRPVAGTVRGGVVWEDDPHATRLFFAPTGRALSAGEGYFGVYELFFPFVTYGVTNRFTVAAGTPIIPEAIGEFAYVGPKVLLVSAPRMQLSAGVFAGFFDGGTAGIAYGVGTWGDRDNAFTAGAGWGFTAGEGNGDVSNRPLVMLGAESRTGRRTKFLTENYFVFGESGALVSGGLRFFGERLSADAGLGLLYSGDELLCCLPLINFVYSFGERR